MTDTISARASGEFTIGGDLTVRRLGFGSMQLTGPNGFGPSRDASAARAVLRRAVELGVNLIDTADAYGPDVAEELVAEALHPYPDDIVIATKGGFVRDGRGAWIPDGRPGHLRDALEGSLRRLRLESIDLYQLHRVDHRVPLADQIGTLAEFRAEGKIRHVGMSQVSVGQLADASAIVPIVTVQNRYNLADRASADVVSYAAQQDIGFIPWFPLATGELIQHPVLRRIAGRRRATTSQIALAWLLQSASVMLPIPGTSQVSHLEQNVAAAGLTLDPDEIAELDVIA